MTVVHLAGPAIRVAWVIRQRCAWCGALIDEIDLEQTAVPEGDPSPWPLHEDDSPCMRWTGFVEITEHVPEHAPYIVAKYAIEDPDDGSVPEGSCMNMPNEVTA